MNHGGRALEEVISLVIREDGSLKTDLLQDIFQTPSFDQTEAGEPVIVVLRYLTLRDAFRVFLDPPGNVGEGHFLAAEKALTFARQYLEKDRLPESGPSLDRILEALDKTQRKVASLWNAQREIDALLSSDDPGATFKESVQQLVQQCLHAKNSGRNVHHSLKGSFWSAWIVAWALRLNCVEENGIQTLKELYGQCPWLDRRVDGRKALRPPGGMKDPDEQPEGADVWLF